jgi:hypothetical protein
MRDGSTAPSFLYWLRNAHQDKANDILTRLAGSTLHPARVMAWADANHLDYRHAIDLLRTAETAGRGLTPQVLLQLRACAMRHDKLAPSRDTSAPTGTGSSTPSSFVRLSQAYVKLPIALTSLRLAWAHELLATIETTAADIASDGSQATPQRKLEAASMLEAARKNLAAEQSKRMGSSGDAGPEQRWLRDASDRSELTASERVAMSRLMHHYQVPELPGRDGHDVMWVDMRRAAKAESDLFFLEGQLPADVLDGRYTRAQFFERISSARSYADYLMGDAPAFRRIADQHLYPEMIYGQLVAEAANGGVLREPQLRAIAHQPDAQLRVRLASKAYETFRGLMRHDWGGVVSNPNRCAYREFANFLATDEGAALFEGIRNPDVAGSSVPELVYQANVLDFIGNVEAALAHAVNSPGPDPLVLQRARSAVLEQITLVEERGVDLHSVANRSNATQALRLLRSLLGRIDRLSGAP